MRERPGQVRETETATPGRPSLLPAHIILPCPSFLSPGPALQPAPPPNSCWRSLCREAPWGPSRPAFQPFPLRARRTRPSCLLEVREGRSPSALPSRLDFSFQLRVRAEQNKLSPFHGIITVTLGPSCHLLLHQHPHLAKLEGRRGHVHLWVTVLAREGRGQGHSGAWMSFSAANHSRAGGSGMGRCVRPQLHGISSHPHRIARRHSLL